MDLTPLHPDVPIRAAVVREVVVIHVHYSWHIVAMGYPILVPNDVVLVITSVAVDYTFVGETSCIAAGRGAHAVPEHLHQVKASADDGAVHRDTSGSTVMNPSSPPAERRYGPHKGIEEVLVGVCNLKPELYR